MNRVSSRNVGLLWFGAVLLLLGCIGFFSEHAAFAATKGPSPASQPPQLEDSFAVSDMWEGQILPIFIRGSDADGDMKHLWIYVSQLGGRSASEVIPLRGEDRREFDGHVAIYIRSPLWTLTWETLRVEIRIRDEAGHLSEKRTHEIRVGAPTREPIPAEWSQAAQHRLGTIFFTFEPPDNGRGPVDW